MTSKAFVILGNQLFPTAHLKDYKDHVFFMAEDYGLCTYVKHHKQKILLLFIYLEVLGMVTSYWGTQRIRLTYPLFIAITAIGRLIILQKKDIDAISLIYESSAILLIAIAIVVLRFRKSKKLEVTLHKDDL